MSNSTEIENIAVTCDPADDPEADQEDARTAPLPEEVHEDASHGDAANVTTELRGRVLLLEDDPCFNEIVQQFFVENGYAVTAVKNGSEALNEVFKDDYTVILCDMILPSLRGDTFYRVVERLRPHLCERFVFMTGHRGDPTIDDFIKSTNVQVLVKPFQFSDLLGIVCTFETRKLLAELREPDPVAEPERPAPEPASEVRAEMAFPSRKRAEVATRKFIPVPIAEPADPAPTTESAPTVVEPPPESRRSTFGTPLLVAAVVAVVVILLMWHYDLRTRAAASSAELLVRQQQWTATSALLQKAEAKRRGLEAALNRAERIAQEADAPRWTQALRSVATAAGADVELKYVQARGELEAPAAFHLRMSGVCTGRKPREVADRFRQALEANLNRSFGGDKVTTRFARLEDKAAPSSAEPDDEQKQQVVFTITASSGSKEPAEQQQSGGR